MKTAKKEIIKIASEMAVKKPLSYYEYETPKIYITWYGKIQPGYFKTANEAMDEVRNFIYMGEPISSFAIYTPDGILRVVDYINKN